MASEILRQSRMPRSGRFLARSIPSFLIATAMFAIDAGRAQAQPESDPGLHESWDHDPSRRTIGRRGDQYLLRVSKFPGSGAEAYRASSRFEPVWQTGMTVGELMELNSRVSGLKIRTDYQLAGEGPARLREAYFDTADGVLARDGAVLRLQQQEHTGRYPTLEFIPPGERLADGTVHRVRANHEFPGPWTRFSRFVERRHRRPFFRFLGNPRLVDNPLRELLRMYPGRSVLDFFESTLEVNVRLTIDYALFDRDGHRLLRMRLMEAAVQRGDAQFQYGQVEITRHVEAVNLEQIRTGSARRPHRASDIQNPTLVDAPGTRQFHELSSEVRDRLQLHHAVENRYLDLRRRIGTDRSSQNPAQRRQPSRPRRIR